MKKIEITHEINDLFRANYKTNLLFIDLATTGAGESFLKIVNRKGRTYVYALEKNDNIEKLSLRITEIYKNLNKTNLNYIVEDFEDTVRLSNLITTKKNIGRTCKNTLFQEDSFFKNVFVEVHNSTENKKGCKYISVFRNGKVLNHFYDFEKLEKMEEIIKSYDNSNIYYLINEEEELLTKEYKKAIEALKNGDNVEVSSEISWEVLEFENYFLVDDELLSKDDYTLTYDNQVIDNADVVYCEDVGAYVYYGDAFYLADENMHYYDDAELTYSELEETYILDSMLAYVIDNQGHEQAVHVDSLDNYYFDEDEGVYYTDEAHFNNSIIQNYGKTALPFVSSGKKDYYIGIELEMEKEDSTLKERNDIIVSVLNNNDNNNFSNLLDWKKDGSLEKGVEMVTAPISIDIFQEKIIPVIEKLKAAGFTSEQGGRCGNHIHISKNVFSEEAQSRLVLIYAKFEKQIKILSRRGTNNSYCKDVLENVASLEVENSMQVADRQKNKSKCTAINFSNKNTIEFRVFRGTMNTNILIANIQLVQLLADWSRKNLTVYDILNLNINDFKNEIITNAYNELLDYCIEKEVI